MSRRLLTLVLVALLATFSLTITAQEDLQDFDVGTADIDASNGVVHSIDTVLVPQSVEEAMGMTGMDEDLAVEEEGADLEVPSELPEFVPDNGPLDELAEGNFEAILDEVNLYVGEQVFFEASIDEDYGDVGANTVELVVIEGLDEDGILAIDPTGELNLPEIAVGDADVFVIGTLRLFVEADVEADFDLDLDDDFFVDYDQEPVLILEQIAEETDEPIDAVADTATGPLNVPDELPEFVPDNGPLDELAESNFEFILDDTNLYLGQEVFFEASIEDPFPAVGADTVELVLSEGADDDVILGIDPTGELNLAELAPGDADAFVIGTLRLMVITDLEDEFGFDLDDDFFVDYEQEPVLIISQIAMESDEPIGDMAVEEDEPAEEMTGDQTVVDIIVNSENHTILEEAVQTAGLVEALNNADTTYTIFAPTDEAFTNALEQLGMTQEELLNDTETLTSILQYHVVQGEELFAADISEGVQEIETLGGEILSFDLSD